jgi:hypothetical protein
MMISLFFILLMLLVPIDPDKPMTISVEGRYVPVDLAYMGKAGEIVAITAHSQADEPIDITLELLLDNQRLAFNDDHQRSDEALHPTDAVIDLFVLPADGEYTIRVNSFSGAQSGNVEVAVQTREALPTCRLPMQIVELPGDRNFSCVLEPSGQVTMTARDLSGTLDPVLAVYAGGRRIGYNDDHESSDVTLNTLDAQLSLFLDEEGVLTVGDFTGAAGTLELTVEIEP